jgi:molybdenum transport protein
MRALHDAQLCALLDDDVPSGDLTTQSLGIATQAAQLRFSARYALCLSAIEEAARLFELSGACAQVMQPSGTQVAAGQLLLRAQGSAGSLHRAWKTAQTLVECYSGIASATAAIVAAAQGVPVACTRKAIPGTKALAAQAVRAGGGIMHRLGLSETLLVFAEHRLFLHTTPAQTVAQLRRTQPEKKIVVEVADVAEALLWAEAGADVLQLEKFSPAQVSTCRAALPSAGPRPLLAAAGGIKADNAAAYVAAGADCLVTSAPYTAPPRDVQVDFVAPPSAPPTPPAPPAPPAPGCCR